MTRLSYSLWRVDWWQSVQVCHGELDTFSLQLLVYLDNTDQVRTASECIRPGLQTKHKALTFDSLHLQSHAFLLLYGKKYTNGHPASQGLFSIQIKWQHIKHWNTCQLLSYVKRHCRPSQVTWQCRAVKDSALYNRRIPVLSKGLIIGLILRFMLCQNLGSLISYGRILNKHKQLKN